MSRRYLSAREIADLSLAELADVWQEFRGDVSRLRPRRDDCPGTIIGYTLGLAIAEAAGARFFTVEDDS